MRPMFDSFGNGRGSARANICVIVICADYYELRLVMGVHFQLAY